MLSKIKCVHLKSKRVTLCFIIILPKIKFLHGYNSNCDIKSICRKGRGHAPHQMDGFFEFYMKKTGLCFFYKAQVFSNPASKCSNFLPILPVVLIDLFKIVHELKKFVLTMYCLHM